MKTNIKLLAIATIAFVSLTTISCSKDSSSSDSTPAPKTITQTAQANPNLSLLVKALTKTGLAETLNGAGTYTVFAPDDAAFTAAGYTSTSIDALTDAQTTALKNVLLNHVIGTKYTSSELTTGYKKTLATPAANPTGKMDVYISNSASGVFLNKLTKVTTANTSASNGVIHIVNKVIALPTIVTFVGSDSNLTSLYTALTQFDQSAEGFVTLLNGTASSPFTVFAPTNAAFTTYSGEAGNSASDLTGSNLTKILKYHVVPGQNLKSTTLVGTTTPISTYLGDPQTISIVTELSSGTKIKDQNNRSTSFTTVVDIQADNGIIHQIANVLKPTL